VLFGLRSQMKYREQARRLHREKECRVVELAGVMRERVNRMRAGWRMGGLTRGRRALLSRPSP
jgi:hypothetical protein